MPSVTLSNIIFISKFSSKNEKEKIHLDINNKTDTKNKKQDFLYLGSYLYSYSFLQNKYLNQTSLHLY